MIAVMYIAFLGVSIICILVLELLKDDGGNDVKDVK